MAKDVVLKEFEPTELLKIVSSSGLVPQELKPYVKPALNEFKTEMAAELGIAAYDKIDKGDLPSRMNGKVGGGMTQKMVAFAEAVLAWHYRNKMLTEGKTD
ncbi:alpha/beta-type small acid-soluble spore protein [Peptococcaceae bacterium 1198_IL3148]